MGPIQRPNKWVLETLSMGAMRPGSQQSSAEVKNGAIHPLPPPPRGFWRAYGQPCSYLHAPEFTGFRQRFGL
jgi:hypothetical protein